MQIKSSTKQKENNNQLNRNELSNEKKVDINILLNRVKNEKKKCNKKKLYNYFWCCRLSLNYRADYSSLKQFKVFLASISVVKFFFVKFNKSFFNSKILSFFLINFPGLLLLKLNLSNVKIL